MVKIIKSINLCNINLIGQFCSRKQSIPLMTWHMKAIDARIFKFFQFII